MIKIYKKEEPFIGSMTGLLTFPDDYTPGEKLPMIVFLHGAGEVGDGTEATIEKVKIHGIPKYFSKDAGFMGVRVITAAPQCISGLIWDQLTLQLKDWIDSVAKDYGVENIALTGISMGGCGTWNMLTTFPDMFYKFAPVCADGIVWRVKPTLKGVKIWAFHSLDDDAVYYENGAIIAKRARLAGCDIKFTTYTDKGHGCWEAAYEESGLIPWLAKVEKRQYFT